MWLMGSPPKHAGKQGYWDRAISRMFSPVLVLVWESPHPLEGVVPRSHLMMQTPITSKKEVIVHRNGHTIRSCTTTKDTYSSKNVEIPLFASLMAVVLQYSVIKKTCLCRKNTFLLLMRPS